MSLLHPGIERRLRRWRKRGRNAFLTATASWRKLPDFLIIGVQKGGTTSLYAYLQQHPEVSMSNHKEPYFFSFDHERGLAYYRRFFPPRWRPEITGEATPEYLWHPAVPGRIRALLPEVKFIVLLRDPIERAFSNHQMNLRKGWETEKDFSKVVAREKAWLNEPANRLPDGSLTYDRFFHFQTYIAKGRYGHYLQNWLRHFPREQFLILDSHDFFADPSGELTKIQTFLGLPINIPKDLKARNTGNYQTKISDELRAELTHFYQQDQALLKELSGRHFSWFDNTTDRGR